MGTIIGHIIGIIIVIAGIVAIIALFKSNIMDLDGPIMKTEIEISYKIKGDDETDSDKSKSNKSELKKIQD